MGYRSAPGTLQADPWIRAGPPRSARAPIRGKCRRAPGRVNGAMTRRVCVIMNRRSFLTTLTLAAMMMAVRRTASAFQDVEYLEALERAQRDRPRVLSSKGRIAPTGEPGSPFVIHGRVFRGDGRTPAPDMIVFAYH